MSKFIKEFIRFSDLFKTAYNQNGKQHEIYINFFVFGPKNVTIDRKSFINQFIFRKEE